MEVLLRLSAPKRQGQDLTFVPTTYHRAWHRSQSIKKKILLSVLILRVSYTHPRGEKYA